MGRSSTPVLAAALCLALVRGAPALEAIVMRHDREDARYQALARNYPATVSLRRARRPGAPGDTGTLVAPDWVLTAAHVASGLAPGDIADVGSTLHRVERVVLHPEWKSDADIRVDIALVKLATTVVNVRPATLYRASNEAGKVLTFVGRGGNGTGLTGPTAEDRLLRAATNRVERAEDSLLVFRFDAPGDPAATELEGISAAPATAAARPTWTSMARGSSLASAPGRTAARPIAAWATTASLNTTPVCRISWGGSTT